MCISAQDYIFNVQNFYSCTPLRASDSINLYPTLLASLHKFFSYAMLSIVSTFSSSETKNINTGLSV
nr:MAG TPA: hypothetical protein [Caudoviricetes sp.]